MKKILEGGGWEEGRERERENERTERAENNMEATFFL